MKIALVPHIGREHTMALARDLVAEARDHGCGCCGVIGCRRRHRCADHRLRCRFRSRSGGGDRWGRNGSQGGADRPAERGPHLRHQRRPPGVPGRGRPARPPSPARAFDLGKVVHVGADVAGRLRGRSAAGHRPQRRRDREGREPADRTARGVDRWRAFHHLPGRRGGDSDRHRFDRLQPVGRWPLDRSGSRRACDDPRRPPLPLLPFGGFPRPDGGSASRWWRTARWE